MRKMLIARRSIEGRNVPYRVILEFLKFNCLRGNSIYKEKAIQGEGWILSNKIKASNLW